MLTSFRSQLLALLISLVALVGVATMVATLDTLKLSLEQEGSERLERSANVFKTTLQLRAEQLLTAVRILASDFAFKRAIATREEATIASVLDNHGSRINAELVFLLSAEGQILASTNAKMTQGSEFPIEDLFAHAMQQGGVTDVTVLVGQPYEIVMVPVKAPNLIAWIGMGFLLDQQLAAETKLTTNLDIGFIGFDQGRHLALASTLSEADQQRFTAEFSQQRPPLNQPFQAMNDRYLSILVPLATAGNEPVFASLHLDNNQLLQSYLALRQQMVWLFAFSIAIAIVLALLLGRRLSHPVALLSRYAQAIGQGNGVSAPALKGEMGLLANTLSQMHKDVQEREQRLLFQSNHDELTGLYNRNAAEHQLAECLALNQSGTLIHLCIRDFKQINSSLGYHNGDQVLCHLGKRLQDTSPGLSFSARLGGDEFLLVCQTHLHDDTLMQLLQTLEAPLLIEGSHIGLRLAAGVVNYPAQGHEVDALFRRVDIALQMAKTHNLCLCRYQEGSDERYLRELQIIRSLDEAMSTGQIYMVYQPKVQIQQGRCLAAEALIRWQHPELGFIPPDEFIALAEHSGNINRLTLWVLEQVLEQQIRWRNQQIELQVAVNLSALDLAEPELPIQILALLQRYQLPAQVLSLEVTEGAVMQNPEQVIRSLQQLREAGLSLAIDDFGTGHSSLAYLKRLPVNEVKIDKAFVQQIEHNQQDRLIVSTTLQLAHGLGLKVTAEGAETAEGCDILRQQGCDLVQGYFFSKPLKATELAHWLEHFAAPSSGSRPTN